MTDDHFAHMKRLSTEDNGSLSRREFLVAGGAALAGGTLASRAPANEAAGEEGLLIID